MSSQIYTILSFLLFISVSILHLFTLMRNNSLYKGVTKGFLMPLLLLFYCVSIKDTSLLIILALVCSFIGDVGLFKANRHPLFYQKGSIFSFALTHLFYTLYLFPLKAPNTLLILSFIGALSILVIFYLKIIHPLNNKIKIFLLLYAMIITIMATSAFIILMYVQTIGAILIFSGAVFFVFSDFLISNQILEDHKNNEIAIMISYILAQFLLIVGIILTYGE